MKPLKDWFGLLLSEDRRKAKREKAPQISAYHSDGTTARVHEIRDISFTGLYLHTEEHWTPGTVVTLTLQKASSTDRDSGRSVTIQCQVVRSNSDGAGLRFVLHEPAARQSPTGLAASHAPSDRQARSSLPTADKQTFKRFLRKLRTDKGQALIEYILLLPLIFLLVVNLVNFGGFFYAWITVANAARAGADYAILGGASAGDLVPANGAQITAVITQDASSLPNASSLTIGICQNNNGTVTYLSGTCSSAPTDPEAPNYVLTTVQVNYTYKPFIPASFQFPNLNIYATLPPLSITRLAYMRSIQ